MISGHAHHIETGVGHSIGVVRTTNQHEGFDTAGVWRVIAQGCIERAYGKIGARDQLAQVFVEKIGVALFVDGRLNAAAGNDRAGKQVGVSLGIRVSVEGGKSVSVGGICEGVRVGGSSVGLGVGVSKVCLAFPEEAGATRVGGVSTVHPVVKMNRIRKSKESRREGRMENSVLFCV